ncbi:unnamed protein product [Protopolystoma xenopodis]|uniref:Uncharacterized protein n=1 Tax=Protopolystoma xenopodis TaxID=117903 RepID=A0A448WR17_9PLAT|nr:unnamed protein product [Protopolystoma xenopodis]
MHRVDMLLCFGQSFIKVGLVSTNIRQRLRGICFPSSLFGPCLLNSFILVHSRFYLIAPPGMSSFSRTSTPIYPGSVALFFPRCIRLPGSGQPSRHSGSRFPHSRFVRPFSERFDEQCDPKPPLHPETPLYDSGFV